MKPHEEKELENLVRGQGPAVQAILTAMEKTIIGQRTLVEQILLAFLSNGHALIEGIPGLGKTLAVKTFAGLIQAKFQRVQFTPDMLPSDLTGSPVYIQQTANFVIHQGPIFTNILLADEINRAPAKVQSALLEVMEERQVTLGQTTYRIEEPFMVLATQNPIEHDGTYDLPESQLDRFLLKIRISYPQRPDEQLILRRRSAPGDGALAKPIIDPAQIVKIRGIIDAVHVSEPVEGYVLDLIEATRTPHKFKLERLENIIAYGASPRAALNLVQAGKAQAFLKGRAYVTPEDIQGVAKSVLSHRIILNGKAHAEGLDKEGVVQTVLDHLAIP